MVYAEIMTPYEAMHETKDTFRERRLALNLSQKSVSERSGVSLAVLKKFERTGKISFESFLKLAFVLGCMKDLIERIKQIPERLPETLDDLLKQKKRKRGRM
jgi:transcriptional regulator with XRE-family HTH domain